MRHTISTNSDHTPAMTLSMNTLKKQNKPSIGILGGSGFIGFNLSKYFSDRGYNVKSLSRTVPEFADECSDLNNSLVDIWNNTLYMEWLKNIDIIFDCGSSGTPATFSEGDSAKSITNELNFLDYKIRHCLASDIKKYYFFY